MSSLIRYADGVTDNGSCYVMAHGWVEHTV